RAEHREGLHVQVWSLRLPPRDQFVNLIPQRPVPPGLARAARLAGMARRAVAGLAAWPRLVACLRFPGPAAWPRLVACLRFPGPAARARLVACLAFPGAPPPERPGVS